MWDTDLPPLTKSHKTLKYGVKLDEKQLKMKNKNIFY